MTSKEGSLDLVITNVTVIDPILGVVKADVGVKDGKIAGIGKAGNPNIMHGVHPDLVTSTATDAISGEHLILTAGGIDGHVHDSPAAGIRLSEQRHNDRIRRRRGSDRRIERHDHYVGTLESRPDTAILRRTSGQRRSAGQGQLLDRPAARRADRGRRLRLEDTRGLGLDAGSHTRRTGCCRPLRRTGGHTLRYAQRGRIRRGYDRRDRRPHHTHLSHRGVREAAMRPTC